MSAYFKLTGRDADITLAIYVYAEDSRKAFLAIEEVVGGLSPQKNTLAPIKAEDIPEGEEVFDEPEDVKEARLDGTEYAA